TKLRSWASSIACAPRLVAASARPSRRREGYAYIVCGGGFTVNARLVAHCASQAANSRAKARFLARLRLDDLPIIAPSTDQPHWRPHDRQARPAAEFAKRGIEAARATAGGDRLQS